MGIVWEGKIGSGYVLVCVYCYLDWGRLFFNQDDFNLRGSCHLKRRGRGREEEKKKDGRKE